MNRLVRVLYVDDYPLDRELVRDALEREHGGFDLVEAASRGDFETALAQGRFDLVLSDFNILGFEGLQVLEAVGAKDPHLPVIIVTGTGSEEVAAEAIKRGAADYVIKSPKHIQRLPHIIHTVLEKKRLEAERQQVEVALRESENKFKYVFDYSIIGKSLTLPSGELSVNQAFGEMLGYTQAELQGQRWQDITHPDDLELTQRVVDALLSGAQDSARFSKRYLHKDGSIVWADVSTSLRRDEAGNPLYFITSANDVTARRQAEEALRQSEERYRLIADHVGDVVWHLDEKLRLAYVSPAIERVLGYTPQEALGVPVADFLNAAGIAQMQRVTQFKLEHPDKTADPTEYRMQHKDGHWVDVEVVSSPVFDDNQRLIGFAGITRDITERKQAEAALQESEERFRTAFHTSPDAITINRLSDELYLEVNEGFSRLTGYTRGEVVGRSSLELAIWVDPDDRGRLVAGLQADGVVENLEVQFRRKDGEARTGLISARALRLGDDLCILSITRDITEWRHLEQQLRRQERLAAVGQLAAGIAHDFRNLLTTITLYAQLSLHKPDLPLQVGQALEIIQGESKKAATLIQQILDFSSRAIVTLRPVDLGAGVAEIVATLRRTLPENIRLTLTEDTEDYTIAGDLGQIQQVLLNLALNSRDAMPAGGDLRFTLSRLTVQPEETPPVVGMPPGVWVCLAVADTGAGMSEAVTAHLFEPFFTTKEVGKGTGLGLAQVYGIVRQHGGHIGVKTAEGVGTTFTLYFPASNVTPAVAVPRATAPPGHGETLLLVEDDDRLRTASRSLLETLGYHVITARQGCEAFEIYTTVGDQIDLVITDIVMPEMGGKELLLNLRRWAPQVKVLGITGYAMQENLETLQQAGFLDVLHKPFDIETLAQAIRRALTTL